MRCIELIAHRVGAKKRRERNARLEQFHRRQCARIGEHDAGAVLELENESREPRKLLVAGTDDPVTGHAKVHVQHGAIVEHRELMLATALDARD